MDERMPQGFWIAVAGFFALTAAAVPITGPLVLLFIAPVAFIAAAAWALTTFPQLLTLPVIASVSVAFVVMVVAVVATLGDAGLV
jgi:hypothetical protein